MFNEELKLMTENLPQYFYHLLNNPDSLIARIYGVFQVKMDGMNPVNLLLMANTIKNLDKNNKITKVFDLKGSRINRLVTKGENQTMKDMNLVACKKNRRANKRRGVI